MKKLFRVFESNLKADPEPSYYTDVDPDPTYALTYDNLVKMLAIQMRFRYSMFVCLCNNDVILIPYTIQLSCRKTFAVFSDEQPSVKVSLLQRPGNTSAVKSKNWGNKYAKLQNVVIYKRLTAQQLRKVYVLWYELR